MPDERRFPSQVRFILGNEACERFSFYGMRSVLPVYVTSVLLMTNDSATQVIHLFIFANYLMTLFGGWISDRFWGRYKTILWISLLYCVGHGVLALADLSPNLDYKKACLYLGLGLIAFGAGGIKPCVSAFMGDQFKPGQAKLLQKAYAAFYWCINLGSFSSMLLIPLIKDNWGWSWAFGIPGILMALATFVFWLGRKRYVFVEPANVQNRGERKTGFASIVSYALLRKERRNGDRFWTAARRKFSDESVDGVIATLRVMMVFSMIPMFWALFDQSASTWVFQGKQMEELTVFGLRFTAEQFQAANPAFVMMLIPLVVYGIYPLLGNWATPLRRVTLGLGIAGVAYFLVGWLQMRLEQGEQLSLLWQLLPYFVITLGEVLVSVTGLEFAFTQAPKAMKSTITSFWLLTTAAGQLIVVAITHFGGAEGDGSSAVSSGRFFLYGEWMLVVTVVFAVVAAFYRYRKEEEAPVAA